ncbi:mono-functional DNA-alkylating methyl methanesulfonate N-term-domain-containing protein [Zychaea mexicana]|uniref:mono-functional DNA-alkylating methyl methanesulfonate N-term-domain-containing protein n=1 Tax=Zychaea mexicana TaxID=64656 RepID=UPI0022FF2BD4|nr:mono-functional DNA-alkylating methyl methanesulfonate N-term-domain-containing protein [Zychaea mexicana]KAI9493741.1 mono-functional DNA-alkylating methyl methanesulfonate N-term-domain-containing protein [Zychaea mexicana]
MSEYNYVSTTQPPTAIHGTARGNFLVPNEECLIVSKSTRIEFYKITSTGLSLELEFGVFGRVESLAVCNASSRERCSLFILTDQDQYCVLSYDPVNSSVVTDSSGKLEPEITRPVEDPIIITARPRKDVVIASIHGGFLHVFPIQSPKSSKGKGKAVGNSQPFSVRVTESHILSMVVLENPERPVVAVLYVDEREVRRIKTYEINLQGRDLFDRRSNGIVAEIEVDSSDHFLAAVPAPHGGLLVIGELMITYHNMREDTRNTSKSTSINSMVPTAYEFLGPNTTECLIGDSFGNLLHLNLTMNYSNNISDLTVNLLGKTSVASSITYLGDDMVFIGSALGDSSMIQLKERVGDTTLLDVIYEMPSLSPIVDFCVFDLDKRGRQTLVCCSGGPNNGSLRVVQEGVGFIEQAALPIPGIKKLWSLKSKDVDDVLIISTVHETRVLYIPPGEKMMEEMELFSAMRMNETTLAVGSVSEGKFLQITPSSVRLIKSNVAGELVSEWQPPSGEVITVAAANATQCVVSHGNGTLVYIQVAGDGLSEKSSKKFESEISCLDISPVDDGSLPAAYVAIGLWGGENLQLARLPELQVVAKDVLPDKLVPRSVLLVGLEKIDYLMVTLGDGQMISYTLDEGSFTNRQEITLGTHSVSLHVISQDAKKSVFAASDHPTMITSEHGQLIYSAVDLKDARACTTFNSTIMRKCLLLSTGDKLVFGTVDPMRKLHYTKVPLDDQMGQRLAYHDHSKTIAVGTSRTVRNQDNGSEYSKGWLRIFDARTFQVLDSHALLEQELVESITTAYIDDLEQEFVFVGTAITHNEEETQLTGRILAYQVAPTGEYKLVDAFNVPGVVYCIKPFMGSIIAAVEGSLYYLEKLKLDEESGSRLSLDMKLHANVEALSIDTRGEFILVGDMIRSMSLVKLQDPSNATFQKVAADYSPCWMTCVKILQDDIFLGAETYYNLFTAKRTAEIDSEDDSAHSMHLDIVGEYHLGDQVNCFREGSLSQWATKAGAERRPPVTNVLYATANGAIGAIRSLTEEEYKFLSLVQTNLLSVVQSIGNFDHHSWRMFKNSTKTSEMRNFIDGDLIENYLKLTPEEKQKVIQGEGRGEPLSCTARELDVTISNMNRGV